MGGLRLSVVITSKRGCGVLVWSLSIMITSGFDRFKPKDTCCIIVGVSLPLPLDLLYLGRISSQIFLSQMK
jgi:hypothetical protein